MREALSMGAFLGKRVLYAVWRGAAEDVKRGRVRMRIEP